jgi:hypothetical protein
VRDTKNRVATLIKGELVLLVIAELLGKRVKGLLDVTVNRVLMEAFAIGPTDTERRIVVLAQAELPECLIPADCRKAHHVATGYVVGLENLGLRRLVKQPSGHDPKRLLDERLQLADHDL